LYLSPCIPAYSPHPSHHQQPIRTDRSIDPATRSTVLARKHGPCTVGVGRPGGSSAPRRPARRRGHHLRPGQLRRRALPDLRPRRRRAVGGLLQRREEPQGGSKHDRRPAHRLQLPQERGPRHQGAQRRQRRQHPLQVRRQRPLHHQRFHRLLQGELSHRSETDHIYTAARRLPPSRFCLGRCVEPNSVSSTSGIISVFWNKR
uniref:Uncharacterized protein n=1 Tax=Oryza glumipatula TaxID=40148 RepID=A0A0E0BMX2_9ORYZ